MNPKTLEWSSLDDRPKIWMGHAPGVPQVEFIINQSVSGKYHLHAIFPATRSLVIRSLAAAQALAQEQFNSFAYCLFEPLPPYKS